MRVLLDHCVDAKFGELLSGHQVETTKARGWEDLSNGRLLSAAEEAGFDVLLTTDKNLRFQQSFSKRKISLMTLNSRLAIFAHIMPLLHKTIQALDQDIEPGSVVIIEPD